MVVVKVFGLELATKTLFKAANAKTSAPRLHPRLHPDDVADKVNFGVVICCLLDALRIGFESSLKFDSAEESGRGVEATVNAKPTLDDVSVA